MPVLEKTLPEAGLEPVSYTTDARRVTGSAALPPGELLTGTVTNVDTLSVDSQRTCLSGDVTYRIVSDGPTVLTLSDGRQIVLREGINTGTLASAGTAAPAPVAPEAPLAALLPLVAVGLAAGFVLRRRATA